MLYNDRMTREKVLEALGELEPILRREHVVRSLALFGSSARGAARETSDVDLLVEFARPVGLLHLIGTQQFLERALHGLRVDLVLRHSVIEELKADILKDAIDVFNTPEVAVSAKAYAGGDQPDIAIHAGA